MSKVLTLTFDTTELKLKGEPPENKVPTTQELTRRIICNVLYMFAEQHQGLTKIERGQAYWLQNNLKVASDTKLLELEIPDDIFGFLRKIFREVKASPDKIMECVEKNIDEVKME